MMSASAPRSVYLLINCGAREMQTEEARSAFAETVATALPDATLWFTSDTEPITQLVDRAIAAGATTLVAGGGDGTINAVASKVFGTARTLGVLPLGTLNHFALDAGVPTDMQDALAAVAGGAVTTIDVGQVNDRIFLNNSGLGIYPAIVHQREIRQAHGASKWSAALASAVRALSTLKVLRIRIVAEGRATNARAVAVLIGNNTYRTTGPFTVHRDSLVGGQLCVYLPRSKRALPLLWSAIRALISPSGLIEGFDVLETDDVVIDSRASRLRVSLDGEVTTMTTPLRFRSLPRALRIIVPAEQPASGTSSPPSPPAEGR